MCSNYVPVASLERLLTFFGVEYGKEEKEHDVFPLGMAPFLRLTVEGQEGGRPAMLAEEGMFGLQPTFATEMQYGRRTYNCRSETVHQKPSFRPTWNAGQRCVIPADAVYEPCYETGKRVPAVAQPDWRPPFHVHDAYSELRDASVLQAVPQTRRREAHAHLPAARGIRPLVDLRNRRRLKLLQAIPWAFPWRARAAGQGAQGCGRAAGEG